MRKVLAISLVLLFAVATAAVAREIERIVPMLERPTDRGVPLNGVFGVSQGTDTFYFGGTVIVGGEPFAAAPSAAGWSNRKQWTFSSTGYGGVPHSGLPYDGWKPMDYTTQEENYSRVMDNTTLGATCVIAGSRSLFIGGATNAECITLCFSDVTGTGYGNGWNQCVNTPTYNYGGSEQISLSYAYKVETENNYDFCYVILQLKQGADWVDFDTLATYDGRTSKTENVDIDNALSGVTTPVDFRILFNFAADGGYSDADGMESTTCGPWFIDSYVLTDGGVADSEDFEGVAIGALPATWGRIIRGCGRTASVQWLASLSPNITSDPCVVALPGYCGMDDSVLTFYDPTATGYPYHPLCQDEYCVSPTIDATTYPGLPGRIVYWERLAYLPLTDLIFMYWQARYTPGCASGGWSTWLSDNYVYYTPEGLRCALTAFDMSAYIPPTAEEIQVSVGVLNYCDEDPWGDGCSYNDNKSPYFDNFTVGLYGNTEVPYVDMRELDCWQDQFAEDGTLNPLSTADSRTSNYLSNYNPPIFADTLVCRGAADDMEVWYCFRMAKVGPEQTNVGSRWTDFVTKFPGVTDGLWREVRMDTAEVTDAAGTGTIVQPPNYMCTFLESYGYPEGTEIIPNQVFSPGTKIEWFIKANYIGSPDSFYLFTPTSPEEFEVLPSMVSDGEGSYEWPCLIYADHFGQRGNWGYRNATYTRNGLNTHGYPFDMYNRMGPSSDLRNGIARYAANTGQIGVPGDPDYNWGSGATLYQMLAYTHCILNSGNIISYSIYSTDRTMLLAWMSTYGDADHRRFLWLSGDGWARYMNSGGSSFLNNQLCATYLASSYAVTRTDFTYCLPMDGFTGRINCGNPESFLLRSNGCPRNFNIIGLSSSGGCAGTSEVEFYRARVDGYVDIAAVSNAPGGTKYYRTFVESYDYCAIRDAGGTPLPLACNGTWNFMVSWFQCVLGWGGYTTSSLCTPTSTISVDPGTTPPAVVTSLGQAFPNPMNPTATIKFSIGTPGKVTLRVFDVSGRVIRTLVNDTKPTGEYSVMWDGKSDGGDRVASGVFFYQLDAPGHQSAKKIVILQ